MSLTLERGDIAIHGGGGQAARGHSRCGEESVRFLRPVQDGVPVAYASASGGLRVKERLVKLLMDRLLGCASGEKRHGPATEAVLERNAWGRPLLWLGETPGPVVSFSHCEGRTWAALAWARGVGIDAATPGEFAGSYPLSRAFREQELSAVAAFGRGPADAAALLWSIKEASVKALGCGFHLLDPLEVEIGQPVLGHEALLCRVNAGASFYACSLRKGNAWLTIAILA